MTTKTAKLFTNGGSQAVRLPAEFRFDTADEVYIRRDAVTGEVVLSDKPVSISWDSFFAMRDDTDSRFDFMGERGLNGPLKPRALLEEP